MRNLFDIFKSKKKVDELTPEQRYYESVRQSVTSRIVSEALAPSVIDLAKIPDELFLENKLTMDEETFAKWFELNPVKYSFLVPFHIAHSIIRDRALEMNGRRYARLDIPKNVNEKGAVTLSKKSYAFTSVYDFNRSEALFSEERVFYTNAGQVYGWFHYG